MGRTSIGLVQLTSLKVYLGKSDVFVEKITVLAAV